MYIYYSDNLPRSENRFDNYSHSLLATLFEVEKAVLVKGEYYQG